MHTEESQRRPARPGRRFDDELFPLFAGLWVVSLLRVLGPVLRHETFGAETTLALLATLFLPLAMAESIGRVLRRAR